MILVRRQGEWLCFFWYSNSTELNTTGKPQAGWHMSTFVVVAIMPLDILIIWSKKKKNGKVIQPTKKFIWWTININAATSTPHSRAVKILAVQILLVGSTFPLPYEDGTNIKKKKSKTKGVIGRGPANHDHSACHCRRKNEVCFPRRGFSSRSHVFHFCDDESGL